MAKHKYIKSPEDFLKLWEDYKAWAEDNPYIENTVTRTGEIIPVPRKRPLLRQGFEAFVYRTKKHHVYQYIDNLGGAYNEYLGVITHVRKEWEDDQISGSLAGVYKAPNLTARLNGLTDNSKTEVTGNINTSKFDYSKLSKEALEEIASLDNEGES